MEQITDNMQKYSNYREQMNRLTRAMQSGFYLEAIFIEYAIMEDRLESVLRHSGKWNPEKGKSWGISQKLSRVEKLTEEKKSIAKKYFAPELIASIRAWKENRNSLIHALLKQSLHTVDLKETAEEGRALVKTLCSKTTSHNRAIARQEKEKENV